MQPDIISIASAFLMHSGARHVNFNLTDAQKKILAHPMSKFVVMFAMFYVSTRSIYWSVLLLLIYFLAINMLLNENHALNILPKSWLVAEGFVNEEKGQTNVIDNYMANIKYV